MADPFDRLAERLAVIDAFGRDRLVHWADPLFRGLAMERKVVMSLIAEVAGRERERGTGPSRVLVLDLMACGGGIGAVAGLVATLPDLAEVAYLGFGVARRGSRGLLERGLADASARAGGPSTRCAFHSGSFFDLVGLGQLWDEVVERYGWILALSFEGRLCRVGPEPLRPELLSRLASVDGAVVSFLDPDELATLHPRLALLAMSLGQGIEVEMEILADGGLASLGRVVVEPGAVEEEARQRLVDLLDSSSRFAHRARIRPAGSLRERGEVVEYPSAGFVEDHLLAGLSVERVVPCGAVRVAVVGSPGGTRRGRGPRVPSRP